MMQSDELNQQNPPWVNINHPNDPNDTNNETEGLIANATPVDAAVASSPSPVEGGVGGIDSTTADGGSIADEEQLRETARVAGSGTAGCILGCLIAGPVGAVVTGAGSAYAALRTEGAVGNLARAMGDVALLAKDSASDFEQKYQIGNSTKRVASDAWVKILEIDQQHQLINRTKDAITNGSRSAMELANSNKILRDGMDVVGRGYSFVIEKASGRQDFPTITTADTGTTDTTGAFPAPALATPVDSSTMMTGQENIAPNNGDNSIVTNPTENFQGNKLD